MAKKTTKSKSKQVRKPPKPRSMFMDNYRAMQAFGKPVGKPAIRVTPERDASGKFVADKAKSKSKTKTKKKGGTNEGKTDNDSR